MIKSGQRFGLWTVLHEGERRKDVTWTCRCACGKEKDVLAYNLHSGASTNCGCRRKQITSLVMTTHGLTKNRKMPPEYRAWANMKCRCLYPNRKDYHHYGGRGITICERWLNSFENFYADMGPKPDPSLSLDRIDVNGNYEPSNCRWATISEQRKNVRPDVVCRRKGHLLTPENTYTNPNSGKRLCRICHRERDASFKAKRKAA